MKQTIKKRVLNHLKYVSAVVNKGMTPTNIGLALGIKYNNASSSVSKALKSLVDEKLVRRTKDKNVVLYSYIIRGRVNTNSKPVIANINEKHEVINHDSIPILTIGGRKVNLTPEQITLYKNYHKKYGEGSMELKALLFQFSQETRTEKVGKNVVQVNIKAVPNDLNKIKKIKATVDNVKWDDEPVFKNSSKPKDKFHKTISGGLVELPVVSTNQTNFTVHNYINNKGKMVLSKPMAALLYIELHKFLKITN